MRDGRIRSRLSGFTVRLRNSAHAKIADNKGPDGRVLFLLSI